ncbi:MAG: TIGR03936 family radical SAM-associated protein [Syntrophomonas sp.]
MHLRVEYRVGPDLKFLANLDMMHLMERALRRAEIPYALTDGFNPHIKLSMGTVLPVGVWGEKEYIDLELRQDMDQEEFKSRMNLVLPVGMSINNCVKIPIGTPSLMKIIAAADYCYVIQDGNMELHEKVKAILAEKHLTVPSRGKKKNVEKDLRPGLFAIELINNKDTDIISIRAAAGEPLNIRYDELLELFARWGIPAESIIDIYRSGNYVKTGDDFCSPL